jgi:Arc/MetJ-type ribon-helix-helix transcriptional regulator
MATNTTTVTLTPEQASQLQEILDQGRFTSAEEAIAHSIELLAHEIGGQANYTASAQARIQAGIDASLRGELVSQEEVEAFFQDWERELHA